MCLLLQRMMMKRRRSRDERNERGESPRGSDVGLTGQEESSGT